jgi:(p)ppGpp synthase/HD superfamily hydrolase
MNETNLLRALDFAAGKHSGQLRKSGDGTPYINHPIAVARILAEEGQVTDADVLMAAVLHDTLEDTDATREELVSQFGSVVCRLVEEVTDDKRLPKAERKRLQIEHAPHLSHGAALIKLGDKIANVRDLGRAPPPDWSIERVREYLTWAEAVIGNAPKVNPTLESLFQTTLKEARTRFG